MASKNVITFVLGFGIHATVATEIARRLGVRSGFRCGFKVTFRDGCTTFETTEPVICGADKYATLKAYIDGIRDAVVLSI